MILHLKVNKIVCLLGEICEKINWYVVGPKHSDTAGIFGLWKVVEWFIGIIMRDKCMLVIMFHVDLSTRAFVFVDRWRQGGPGYCTGWPASAATIDFWECRWRWRGAKESHKLCGKKQRKNATFIESKRAKRTIKKQKATANQFMDWARGKGEMR